MEHDRNSSSYSTLVCEEIAFVLGVSLYFDIDFARYAIIGAIGAIIAVLSYSKRNLVLLKAAIVIFVANILISLWPLYIMLFSYLDGPLNYQWIEVFVKILLFIISSLVIIVKCYKSVGEIMKLETLSALDAKHYFIRRKRKTVSIILHIAICLLLVVFGIFIILSEKQLCIIVLSIVGLPIYCYALLNNNPIKYRISCYIINFGMIILWIFYSGDLNGIITAMKLDCVLMTTPIIIHDIPFVIWVIFLAYIAFEAFISTLEEDI